jgi:SAM-dependent methyltransferase
MTQNDVLGERMSTVRIPQQSTTSASVSACRACGTPGVREFLSLGATPIANALVEPARSATPDPSYPLAVGFCPSCSLVQLTHELPAEAMFDANYPYYSSFIDALVTHSAQHVDSVVEERGLGAGSFVVELASNDGYLLRRFVEHGVPVLGVEPTPGPAAAAREAGIPTLEEFFGADTGARIRKEHGAADVIIANNVMAHVPDLNGFVAGMAALVADDGIVQVENPGVRYLLEHCEFDTVYHEHFCYFSTIAVQKLFARHGLNLLDVELYPDLHGGTLRWTAGRTGTPTERALRHLDEEYALGLDDFAAYADFGARVAANQTRLASLLRELRAEGRSIAAYGAAAKGATLLNSTGIGANVIDFVVDVNTHKQGKLIPGARIPVLDPAELMERRPDYVLLLAWNFKNEIMRQQEAYRQAGGRFIVPVPSPQVVG